MADFCLRRPRVPQILTPKPLKICAWLEELDHTMGVLTSFTLLMTCCEKALLLEVLTGSRTADVPDPTPPSGPRIPPDL